ncbi:unnamed protein product, partial [Auanema sp. JU1783]
VYFSRTDRGQKVPEGQWSCQVCEEALNLIVTRLSRPLDDLNRIIPELFCSESDQDCNASFNNVIEVGGALGNLLKKLTSPSVVCRSTLKCLE